MNNKPPHFRRSTDTYIEWVLSNRLITVIASILLTLSLASGMRFLEFTSNYRVFFSQENPELNAFEALQKTYTKNDNFVFLIKPKNNQIFTPEILHIIEIMTAEAWQIPHVKRVDSLTNFQHTIGLDDDLIVENLIENALDLTTEEIAQRKQIALQEPLLVNQLVTQDGKAAAINVTLQYPERSILEVPTAVASARALRAKIEAAHGDLHISLTGVSMLNNAFSEAGQADSATLVPLMILVIMAITALVLRSVLATMVTALVFIFSSLIAMGAGGFADMKLTPVSASAPIVIMTLAIADAIHILTTLRGLLIQGMEKHAAIVEAIKENFLPVSITSLTTIVGFLALNFSDSPPFWHLGNLTAIGIAMAWFFSLTLLPALVSLLPIRLPSPETRLKSLDWMTQFSGFITRSPGKIVVIMSAISIAFITMIPRIELNDQWTDYFDERIEFRRDSDIHMQYFGTYPIEFSVPASGPGGVSEPEYLEYLDQFTHFLNQQPEVTHVYSLTPIMKRLNRNLHGDAPEYYRLPKDRELSAQYLLLYELSLPYGLDLNDRINIDKSATRITATLNNASTAETKAFLDRTRDWIQNNFPDYMQASNPTSAQVMFTYIAERNVSNMILGNFLAIIAIAFIMMFALGSFKLGLLSLVPNALPIAASFGAWGLLVGEIGFSVATISSISLGIIVDDTVHFLTKYVRARKTKGLSHKSSVTYAFQNVGWAIVVNTLILTCGFSVLMTSAFKVNVDMGALTSLSICFALLLDFMFLPALLCLRNFNDADPTKTPASSVTTPTLQS